jgi:hypothetical protein
MPRFLACWAESAGCSQSAARLSLILFQVVMGGPVWLLYLYPPRLRGRVREGAAAAAERGSRRRSGPQHIWNWLQRPESPSRQEVDPTETWSLVP